MPASRGSNARLRLTRFAAAICAVALASPLNAAPRPEEAIEAARALERDGHVAEAELYLRELVATDADLARNASVLLELARLTPSIEECLSLTERALERTRDGELTSRALELQGDYLYAAARYSEACAAYEAAHVQAPREKALFGWSPAR